MAFDQAGLLLSCDSAADAALFDDAVNAYLIFSRDTGKRAKILLTAEPTMPMGNVLMGYFYQLMGSRALVPRAERSLATASEHQEVVTDRERGHMHALAAWVNNDLKGAVTHWESILIDHPRDILAAKLAHFGHFYLGDSQNIRDSIARVLPAWSDQDDAYGFLLSMYAFGLEETGDYEKAERLGRQAVDMNPADTWGVHAVAHVLEMQDRWSEGIDWLDGLEASWSAANNFRYHVAWHRALYHLDQGDSDRALELYDATVWDPESNEYLDLCNDASLLARLDMAGLDTDDRWAALAQVLAEHTQVHIFNFIDAHYALALAAGGQRDAAAEMIAALEAVLSGDWSSSDTYLQVAESVGLDLSRAMLAYANGDYEHVIELMLPIRYDIQQIGGSHAQRDLFAQLLVDATLKTHQLPLARALLAERVALKPDNVTASQQYTTVVETLGSD